MRIPHLLCFKKSCYVIKKLCFSPQLSWDTQSGIHIGPDGGIETPPHTSDDEESIDDHIKEVSDDLRDMLTEVENLKRNSVIYESTTELGES